MCFKKLARQRMESWEALAVVFGRRAWFRLDSTRCCRGRLTLLLTTVERAACKACGCSWQGPPFTGWDGFLIRAPVLRPRRPRRAMQVQQLLHTRQALSGKHFRDCSCSILAPVLDLAKECCSSRGIATSLLCYTRCLISSKGRRLSLLAPELGHAFFLKSRPFLLHPQFLLEALPLAVSFLKLLVLEAELLGKSLNFRGTRVLALRLNGADLGLHIEDTLLIRRNLSFQCTGSG
mmetsp:Transcript_22554/g.65567  ORF Transcript_22554/g.65567 Transcript_22554/m.65567 type:complete len:235 (+) Transcript_22554:1636-2340(+)